MGSTSALTLSQVLLLLLLSLHGEAHLRKKSSERVNTYIEYKYNVQIVQLNNTKLNEPFYDVSLSLANVLVCVASFDPASPDCYHRTSFLNIYPPILQKDKLKGSEHKDSLRYPAAEK